MNLREFLSNLNSVLPPQTAMQGDRIGLQLQSEVTNVKRIMTTMEVTEEVAEEAKQRRVDCIVSFHPLIFAPLTSITSEERVGRIATMLIKAGIALVSVHTTFDAHPEGTSALLARKLGLDITGTLIPDADFDGHGMGVVGSYSEAQPVAEVLRRVASVCHSPIRYGKTHVSEIRRVAIVGGSGASFLQDAVRADVDAYITADLKYHDFHAVRDRLLLIDPGHYEMEQFNGQAIAALLKERSNSTGFPEVVHSEVLPNPVQYYPQSVDYHSQQLTELL